MERGCLVIGKSAFEFCTNLIAVDLSGFRVVKYRSFYCCTRLRDVGDAGSLLRIGECAFAWTALVDLAMQGPLALLENGAFEGSLLRSFTGVIRKVSSSAFCWARNLRRVCLGPGTTVIPSESAPIWPPGSELHVREPLAQARSRLGRLVAHGRSLVTLVASDGRRPPPSSDLTQVGKDMPVPKGVRFADLTRCKTSPASMGFANAFHLVQVRMPDDWEQLPIDFFSGDACLERVLFGEGSRLRTIREYAFQGCASLTRFDPPCRLVTAEFYAFHDCGPTRMDLRRTRATGRVHALAGMSLDRVSLPRKARLGGFCPRCEWYEGPARKGLWIATVLGHCRITDMVCARGLGEAKPLVLAELAGFSGNPTRPAAPG
jgi:hypothetical protein